MQVEPGSNMKQQVNVSDARIEFKSIPMYMDRFYPPYSIHCIVNLNHVLVCNLQAVAEDAAFGNIISNVSHDYHIATCTLGLCMYLSEMGSA